MYTQRLSKRSEYFKVLFLLGKYCFHKNLLKYVFQVKSQVCHSWRFQKFQIKSTLFIFIATIFNQIVIPFQISVCNNKYCIILH